MIHFSKLKNKNLYNSLFGRLLAIIFVGTGLYSQAQITTDGKDCAGQQIQLEYNSKGSTTGIAWSSSDKNISVSKDGTNETLATVTFSQAGNYTVYVQIPDGKGNYTTDSILLKIEDCCKFEAAISGPDTVCQGSVVAISGANQGAGYSASWNFGTGTSGSSSGFGTQYLTFSQTGNQTITLTVSEDCSCNGCKPKTATKTIYVKPSPNVSVSFTPNTPCNYIGDPISFDASSTSGSAITWSFGGASSSSSSGSGASASWSTPGDKVVCATANLNGCIATACATVSVIDNTCPTASFTVPSEICQYSLFELNAVGQGYGVTYSWTLTGSNANTASGQYNARYFNDTSNQTVTLTISKCGCTDNSLTRTMYVKPTPSIDLTGPSCGVSNTNYNYSATPSFLNNVNYTWNFGDGNASSTTTTSTNVQWSSVGNKTVCLTAERQGCSSESCVNTTIVAPTCPVADFIIPTTVCQFSDLDLNAVAQGFGTNYSWTATSGTIQDPLNQNTWITFNTPGTYTITLTVNNCNCADDTYSATITVLSAPTADVVGPLFGEINTSYTFSTNTNVSYTYSWTVDGTPVSTNSSFSSSFSTPGYRNICVTVVGSNGCPITDCHLFGIVDLDCPEAIVKGNKEVCLGDTVRLSANDEGCGVDYFWNIAGQSYAGPNLQGYFSSPGTYPSYLYVTTCGCNACTNDTTYFNIVVNPSPTANILGPNAGITNQDLAFFTNPIPGVTYSWTATGSTATSNTNEFIASWPISGTYEVCVTVTNIDNSCAATDCIPVTIDSVNTPTTPCLALDSFNFGNLGLNVPVNNTSLSNSSGTVNIKTYNGSPNNAFKSHVTSNIYVRNTPLDTMTLWENSKTSIPSNSHTCFSFGDSKDGVTFKVMDLDFNDNPDYFLHEAVNVSIYNNGTPVSWTSADYTLGANVTFANYFGSTRFYNTVGEEGNSSINGDVTFSFSQAIDSLCIEFLSSSVDGNKTAPAPDLGISNIYHCKENTASCLYPAKLEFQTLGLGTDIDGTSILNNGNEVTFSVTDPSNILLISETSTNYLRGSLDTTAYIVTKNDNSDKVIICMEFASPTENVSFTLYDLDFNDDKDYQLTEVLELELSLNGINVPLTSADYSLGSFVLVNGNTFSQKTQMVNASEDFGDVIIHLTNTVDKVCVYFYSNSVDGVLTTPSPDFGISDITACTNVPVPVTWLDIAATNVGDKKAQVTWSTSAEIDNDRFEVQRSLDGQLFETIDIVKGKGTTNAISDYKIIDQNPYPGVSFYRIKQIDYNGDFDYSTLAMLNRAVTNSVLYPNPVTGSNVILELGSPLGINGELRISDLYGNLVTTIAMDKDAKRHNINIAAFRNGAYFVTYVNNGVITTHKLFVNH